MRQGGLREVKPVRRFRQRSFVGDRQQESQVPDVEHDMRVAHVLAENKELD
jgi:hypothetical protein